MPLWREYFTIGTPGSGVYPQSLENVHIISNVEQDESKSEILQWNEHLANIEDPNERDLYHLVHKFDRILKVNDLACTNLNSVMREHELVQEMLKNSLVVNLVVQKRNLFAELQMFEFELGVPARDANGENYQGTGARQKLGMVMSNRDGRYLEVVYFKENSILE